MENKLYRLVFLTAIIFFAVGVQAQRRNARYVEYINKYSDLAVEQMKLHKIPASITLAQGLLESGAGNSQLARKSNNHFGIKCGGSWRGRSVRHDDDARNECFRAYKHPRESYEDHSDFLKRGARYAFLFKLDITDIHRMRTQQPRVLSQLTFRVDTFAVIFIQVVIFDNRNQSIGIGRVCGVSCLF